MDEFQKAQERYEEATKKETPEPADIRPTHKHPQGFEPGITWDGETGSLTMIQPDDRVVHEGVWEEVIKDWGLDPDIVAFDGGSVQIRGWDANVSEGRGKNKVTRVQRMKYYKANLVARKDRLMKQDVDDLIKDISKKRPLKSIKLKTAEDGVYDLVIHVSDWQMGKGEGDGSRGSVNRILDSLDRIVLHIKDLQRVGRGPRYIYLVGMGDLVEQCAGHYPMQTFQADLDRREQMRVVRYLLMKYVDTLFSLCEKLILIAVPGNHGENRNSDGKAYTTFTDNDDLAVFDGVAEACASNPDRYHNVTVLTSEKLSTTFRAASTDDDYGVVIGVTHMHAGRQGADPRTKVMNWWKGHTIGRGDVHDADILVTAHYHHFMLDESTGRTWFQCPAQDPGSAWYTEQTGTHSPPGCLVYSVSRCYGDRNWGDLRIL